ncbi:MAG: hypothetical protein QXG00_00980 [Candidatus Woesearchaeota archaeon]
MKKGIEIYFLEVMEIINDNIQTIESYSVYCIFQLKDFSCIVPIITFDLRLGTN